MRQFSVDNITKQDNNGNIIVDHQRLIDVLKKYRQAIEELEKRLQSAEHDIRDLE